MKMVFFLLLVFISWISNAQSVDEKVLLLNNYEEKIYSDPSVDFSRFRSYSLVSKNQLMKKEEQTLLEKQVEFFLTNVLFWNDLQYIPFDENNQPDLLIVYDFGNIYGRINRENLNYSLPYLKESEKITGRFTPALSETKNEKQESEYYETGYSNEKIKTGIPDLGEWRFMCSEKPKIDRNKSNSGFSAIIYDTYSKKKIWEGYANCSSDNEDFRLSGQAAMASLVNNIPHGSYIDKELASPATGTFGFAFFPFCSDGQRFFPVVISVDKKSAAVKGHLQLLDVITAINGVSTVNKSSKLISLILKGYVGAKFKLTIERDGKILEKKISLTTRMM